MKGDLQAWRRRPLAVLRSLLRRSFIAPELRSAEPARLVPGQACALMQSVSNWRTRLTLALLLTLPAAHACDGLRVDDGWLRLPPPNATTAAAYFTLTNQGAHPVSIVAVSSPQFGHAMLHATRFVDGRAEMRHLGVVTLAAGETFRAEPGASHAMLGAPRTPLDLDSAVELVLECREGSPLRLSLPVARKGP